MTPLAPNPWGDRRRVRIGLLGGSFNPAHDGHRHIAQLSLKLLRLHEVWLLVSPQNPLKSTSGMAALAERLASAQAVMAGNPRLRPTTLETALGTRYTADTLTALAIRFPCARFVWLMGADNLAQMEHWARWPRIFRTVPVAIFARGPYSARTLATKAARRFGRFRVSPTRPRALCAKRPPAWAFLHIRRHPASSTAIRSRLV
ncbi:nicotinate-nucleotide adenylyltransferase [Paramagnetospirillum kuznetsovii]|uniref:Probable nicotinate-nucleotide adenylyltransferase n=1 Tax=Paramagnetospirillum kuznetsovii TaxID=2053833 RepID=A0A364NY38_9PROT|nr:nicotinate-nucleotide adenylyltransferase [Paramagnetospirillum kuznetsovii]RAU21910.1 nicotinate-nucleotide adenylyltransferase [Paramagnetospirillum kuznetsovii]